MKATLTLTPNPALDLYTTVERITPGHKLRCFVLRADPGGGINVARAMRRLGAEAVPVFLAGGVTGTRLEELLRNEGVEARPIAIEQRTRENLIVHEEETGQEYRFVFRGPEVAEEEWQRCLDFLAAVAPVPDYIVASGSLPPGCPSDFYARVARIAKRGRARMVLDTSGEALRAGLEEGTYLVKSNLRELQDLAGRPIQNESDEEDASRELIEQRRSEVVALTLGNRGALLTWGEGCLRVRPPDVEVKSSVGAGDSFVAGMVRSLVRQMPLHEAFYCAVAAGTAALATPGTELCRRDGTENLHRQICASAAES